jgi:cysteine desulfuration protein SufE
MRREPAIAHGVLFSHGFKSSVFSPISKQVDNWTGMMATLEQIIEDFSFLDDWEDRYRYVIELGKALPDLPEEKRKLENKVQGCASQVWLVTHAAGDPENPVLTFEGDSDAHIVRGLVAIVLATYSGKPASEIAALDALDVFGKIGLVEHLSSQRANGLRSMIKRIREEARVRATA